MDYTDLYTLLKTLELPVAYDHFDSNKNINPPFIVYRELSNDTFKADDLTYYRGHDFEIEVITTTKNPTLQTTIENLLTNNNIPYDYGSEVWDEDEKIYHIIYEI